MGDATDAAKLLSGELGQWLDAQQHARRETIKCAVTKGSAIALLIFLILAISTSVLPDSIFSVAVIIVVISAVVERSYHWIIDPVLQFQRGMKERMNFAIAEKFDLTYSPVADPGVLHKLAQQFDLLPIYDDGQFEDGWHGEFDGHLFQICEPKLRRWTYDEGKRKLEPIFEGVLIGINFARKFHGVTMVSGKNLLTSLSETIGKKRTIGRGGYTLDSVKFAHPMIEQELDIFSSDQVEARYLIHPEYCERLLAMSETFWGSLCAVFVHNTLIIVMRTGDQFESSSILTNDDEYHLQLTIEQLQILLNLVETLQEPNS